MIFRIKYLERNLDLLIQLTKREIDLRHKGTKLGHLWTIITPSLMLCLYFFVFGLVFGGKFGVLNKENYCDFALALFIGLSLFNVVAEAISNGPALIINQPNFVKKVVFPLEIITVSKVIASMYFCSFNIIISILLIPLSHSIITSNLFYLPILLLPLIMLSLGLSWFLAALGVFYRDFNQATNFIITLIMYSSAIVYSPSKLPPYIYNILKYNPLLIIIDDVRKVILWDISLNINILIYLYLSTFVIMYIGWFIFNKLRPYFSEVI